MTGPVRHTLTFGTEFGLQAGFAQRDTGYFPAANNGLSNTIAVNPFAPTYFGPVYFLHGVTPAQTDASSRSDLYVQSGYVQDQIELTRCLQLIAGVRYDRFDFTALDQNTNTTRSRVDEKVSPRAAVIVKPVDNLSIYASYAVSYLPASGDQFSALNNGTVILEPQKFENKEVGVKWNILPRLLFTAAVYELNRTNVPIADPSSPGFSFPSGSHKIRGFETALKGYVTDAWQTSFGYAYTDARITSDTSATIVAGNRVQLVPFHQFSWWNKYQFTPMWSAAVGVIYFSGLVRVVRRQRQAAGLRARRCRALRQDQRDLEGAAQCREHLRQGLLGDRRRQQQPLARPVAHDPPDRDGEFLKASVDRDMKITAARRIAEFLSASASRSHRRLRAQTAARGRTEQPAPAAPLPAAQAPDAQSPAPARIPRELSPWSMFMSADILVKAVMVSLAFASLVTWTIFLGKTLQLFLARRRA